MTEPYDRPASGSSRVGQPGEGSSGDDAYATPYGSTPQGGASYGDAAAPRTPDDGQTDAYGSPYAPPYGSAPAYGAGGYGGAYSGGPGDDAPPREPVETGAPTTELPYGGTQVADPPRAATRTPRSRRSLAAIALLVACCLGSGVTGAALVNAFDDPDGTPTAAASSPTISRGTGTPTETATGTPAGAAKTISPSVVTIAVTGTQASTGAFGQTAQQQVSDTGSGIVLSADGYVVTNNHVVAAAVDGGTVDVTFSDGSTSSARIVGTDPTSDLAVIKVTGRTDLTKATFADSDKLVVGQTVLAVGAPLGLSNTVTEGIVSTLHRPVRTGEAGASEQSVIDAVQTDAAINPGNSGGALVDLSGQVVGVNSAIASTGDSSSGSQAGNIGVGFAIPANDVVEVSKELIDNGKAVHPQIGIQVADAAGSATGTPGAGALVRSVTSGGPAASAGLQAGDVITKVDDRAVTDADSLIVAVRSHDPGNTVTITYTRGGATQTAKATLAEAQPS